MRKNAVFLSASLLFVALYGCAPKVFTETEKEKIRSAEIVLCMKKYPEDNTTILVVVSEGKTTNYGNTTECGTWDYSEFSGGQYLKDGSYFSWSGYGYVR